MVYQDRLTTYLLQLFAVRTPRNFRRVFYNFCYYFWGQQFFWTETSIIGNFFLSFHCPQYFHCPSALPLIRRPGKGGENFRCDSLLCIWCRCESEALELNRFR